MSRRLTPSTPLTLVVPELPQPGMLTEEQTAQGIAYLNRNCAWIFDGRNVIVIYAIHPTLHTIDLRFATLGEFRAWLSYHRVQSGTGTVSLAEKWLRQCGDHRYTGLGCDPSGTQPGVFNLWTGWGVTPREGPWDLLQAHLFEIICSADRVLYDWVMRWLARFVQSPSEPAGTAVVLRGGQGVGKGVLWRAILKIAGAHGLYLSHTSSLTSKFNAPLAGKVFLFADEVTWGGDHVGAQVLKSIITEPMLALERKGRDVIQMKNCLHIGMASNNDHAVHVEAGDRRYAVLDVSSARHGQNMQYFEPLHRALDTETPALLYELLHLDIAGWDPFVPPNTAARLDQFLSTLTPAETWLYEQLYDGIFLDAPWSDARELKTSDAYAAYLLYAQKRHLNRTLSGDTFGSLLINKAAVSKCRRRDPISQERSYRYFLPTLAVAREQFCLKNKVTIPWPAEDDPVE